MKKIAIVANSTWNIFNFRMALIQSLGNENYQVIIIAPPDQYTSQLNRTLFYKYIPLPQLLPKSKNPFQDLLLIRELQEIYKKEKPDLILHYTIKPNIYGSIAAQRVGIPSISTLTGLGFMFINKTISTRWVKSLYKVALKKNPFVAFHNVDDLNLFLDEKIISQKQATLIPGSGVDTNFFSPQSELTHKEKFIFLFVGRLLYDKGIREFIIAAQAVGQLDSNIEFWIVGSTDVQNPSAISSDEIKKWRSPQIQFFGSSNDVKSFYEKADVLVLPSYREGLPRTIIEAMSMSKPIISTDAPGCKATVEEGKNGFLVPVKDAESLTEAMRKIIRMTNEEREKMGSESRAKAIHEFDIKIINQKYLALIKSIL